MTEDDARRDGDGFVHPDSRIERTYQQPEDGYTLVDDKAIRELGLRVAMVLSVVLRHQRMRHRVCRASQERIAELAGVSLSTAARALRRLIADGYVVDLTPERRNAPHEILLTSEGWAIVKPTSDADHADVATAETLLDEGEEVCQNDRPQVRQSDVPVDNYGSYPQDRYVKMTDLDPRYVKVTDRYVKVTDLGTSNVHDRYVTVTDEDTIRTRSENTNKDTNPSTDHVRTSQCPPSLPPVVPGALPESEQLSAPSNALSLEAIMSNHDPDKLYADSCKLLHAGPPTRQEFDAALDALGQERLTQLVFRQSYDRAPSWAPIRKRVRLP